jgi:transcriptional regulator with XRE-family HTH domain
MENRKELKANIRRLKPDVKLRIEKVAEKMGLTFEDVFVSLYSRFECDFNNMFMGKGVELYKMAVLKKIKRYDRVVQEGRGGDSSVVDGGQDTGTV